jgi:hypothetical protein
VNPLKYLSPAILAALKAAGLAYEGQAVPVARSLAKPTAGHYVLLHEPTASKLPGAKGCKQWTCTQLVDVVTQFPEEISIKPADDIADQVLAVLDEVALLLPGRWQCGPGVLVLASEIQETNTDLKAVRRLLRLRWKISYHA